MRALVLALLLAAEPAAALPYQVTFEAYLTGGIDYRGEAPGAGRLWVTGDLGLYDLGAVGSLVPITGGSVEVAWDWVSIAGTPTVTTFALAAVHGTLLRVDSLAPLAVSLTRPPPSPDPPPAVLFGGVPCLEGSGWGGLPASEIACTVSLVPEWWPTVEQRVWMGLRGGAPEGLQTGSFAPLHLVLTLVPEPGTALLLALGLLLVARRNRNAD